MSDSSSHSPSTEFSQRKRLVAALAGTFVVVMAFAFLAGGKNTPVSQDTEKDPAVGVLQDGPDFHFDGAATPDDWFVNAPDSGDIAPKASGETAPQTGTKASVVITGDEPSTTANGKPASNTTADSHATSAPAKTSTMTSTAPQSATKTSSSPQIATKIIQSAGDSSKSVSTVSTASKASIAATIKPSTRSNGTPTFVNPTAKRPGVIAQTRALVTEEQFHRSTKTGAPAATAAAPASKLVPAHVRQEEARAYAQQTTENLRKQHVVTPAQRVRLPRKTETPSQTIWREDDTPASAEERRPFGLVIADDKPAFTPEGIPLRTDIPAGTSPLEKAGADKPLWKKPE